MQVDYGKAQLPMIYRIALANRLDFARLFP